MMSLIILLVLVAVLLLVDVCNNIRISYYKQKLIDAKISDGIENLPWYKLF